MATLPAPSCLRGSNEKERERINMPTEQKGKRKLEKWQKKRLLTHFLIYVVVVLVFLSATVSTLVKDRTGEEYYWKDAMSESQEMADEVAARSGEAIEVSVGTYIENLKEINIKSAYFRVVAQVWFRWEGDSELDMKNNFRVYKGLMNKMEVIKDYHENGVNYQLVRCDVTVTKSYWTVRFPLESHQLRMYITSNLPVERVVFTDDGANSGLNRNLGISGYNMRRSDTAVISIRQDGTHGDPELRDDLVLSEHMTQLEINRDGWGLYTKCFIALVGTISWVLIALYLNTNHHIDPLGMLPAALFGTVTNIMVGANLLPDALQIGLLEFVNIFGIMTILSVTLTIIHINRIRNKYEDKEFASILGRVMFVTIIVGTLAGNILLPVSAYLFG